MGAYRINGNLAVSRAFGDRLETPFVSDQPDVTQFEREHETDRFIIIASDGLWDVMTSQEAVRFVQQILAGSVGALGAGGEVKGGMKTRRPSRSLSKWMRTYSGDTSMVRAVLDTRKAKIAKYLVEESLRRGTADNVTVIVIWLR
jgi:serine/threonine protein phosphatase PrpC